MSCCRSSCPNTFRIKACCGYCGTTCAGVLSAGECSIPSCILKSNSHIGEVGQGTDAVGISSELGEACAERVLQSIKGRERLVGQDLLPQFFPDMLGWIEFRTAGRLGQ